ncbi:MAG: hypothetical protein ACLFPJ_00875 [Candidatus Woesearchaeota archaeon]
MLNKKGIEIGLNTIVVAVIALAVMLVVLLVFTGRFGIFSGQLQECENIGGVEMTGSECDGRVVEISDGKECCVSLKSKSPELEENSGSSDSIQT